jgi:adenosyl cobinamide kinase/adenosyl cobinamide phosphate guanylyltransferase
MELGGDKQAVTYDTVRDHIVQYVQKTYEHGHQDIAVSLRDLAKKKESSSLIPERGQSSLADAANKITQQAGMDIRFQAELERRYLDRVDTLEQNMHKAYALIFSTYYNKTMQNRIEDHPDFESAIRDDPIELLEKIKVLMHDPIRVKYPYASLTEALIRLMNIKQFEQEQLLDYIKRFKQFRDITKSHVGTNILDKFVENTREYREETGTENKKVMKAEAFNKWMAYLLIRNSDQAKYGSLMNGQWRITSTRRR